MSTAAIRFFYWFATLGFVASLVAHMSLYAGFNLQIASPWAWLFLHLSILVSFAGLFLVVRVASDDRALYKTPASGVSMLLCILFVVFLFYALFNVFYSDILMRHGYITLYQWKAALFNRATFLKFLTAEELPAYQRYSARRISPAIGWLATFWPHSSCPSSSD